MSENRSHRPGDECAAVSCCAAHRSDPRPHQGNPLFVDQSFAQLGHHDARVRGADPIDQDRAFGVPGHDVKSQPARADAGRHRRLVHADRREIALCRAQVQPAGPRGPFGVVTMCAVDLEPGTGAVVERAGLGVVPDRQPRCVSRCRGTGQGADAAPVRQLILCAARIGKVAVQMPGLGADRHHGLARLVAPFALVDVGNNVVVLADLAVVVNPAHVNQIAGDLEGRVGLFLVPEIRETDPAVGLAFEDPSLDQPASL